MENKDRTSYVNGEKIKRYKKFRKDLLSQLKEGLIGLLAILSVGTAVRAGVDSFHLYQEANDMKDNHKDYSSQIEEHLNEEDYKSAFSALQEKFIFSNEQSKKENDARYLANVSKVWLLWSAYFTLAAFTKMFKRENGLSKEDDQDKFNYAEGFNGEIDAQLANINEFYSTITGEMFKNNEKQIADFQKIPLLDQLTQMQTYVEEILKEKDKEMYASAPKLLIDFERFLLAQKPSLTIEDFIGLNEDGKEKYIADYFNALSKIKPSTKEQ